MSAFDKQKHKTMPVDYLLIKDIQTGLFLATYSTSLSNCTWDVSFNAFHFDGTETQTPKQQVDAAIASWQLGDQSRYIGSNPPHHP